MAGPSERVRRWRESRGLTQAKAAELLGCSPGMVSKIEDGSRRAGRDLAFAIEAATSDWDEGPILATSWTPEPPPDAEPAQGEPS